MGRAQFGKEPEDPSKSKPATPANAAGSSAMPTKPDPTSPEIIAEHKVAEGENLSHISLKYYGSAVREKWMIIYEANRDVIGGNPNVIRPGMVLKIPKA